MPATLRGSPAIRGGPSRRSGAGILSRSSRRRPQSVRSRKGPPSLSTQAAGGPGTTGRRLKRFTTRSGAIQRSRPPWDVMSTAFSPGGSGRSCRHGRARCRS
uniref:Uncharacterized protein n=1 Tax=Podoviridae sp. ctIpM11 TaxID=2825240 RepID=A0A8S5UUD8_9CAUD|nr:MAG TPA: hypothetical protein [Podoviridae sp. ctIpM11]